MVLNWWFYPSLGPVEVFDLISSLDLFLFIPTIKRDPDTISVFIPKLLKQATKHCRNKLMQVTITAGNKQERSNRFFFLNS